MTPALRQATRALGHSLLFSGVVSASLALGIGVTVSAFAAAHHLLWKPLPYRNPARLVVVREIDPNGSPTSVSLENREDFRAGESFEAVACYSPRTFGLRTFGERAEVVTVGQITSDFFDVLGVEPARGRSFSEEEERAETPVIVLTHDLWTARFGADPDIVGDEVLLNELPRTVLGRPAGGFSLSDRRLLVSHGFHPIEPSPVRQQKIRSNPHEHRARERERFPRRRQRGARCRRGETRARISRNQRRLRGIAHIHSRRSSSATTAVR